MGAMLANPHNPYIQRGYHPCDIIALIARWYLDTRIHEDIVVDSRMKEDSTDHEKSQALYEGPPLRLDRLTGSIGLLSGLGSFTILTIFVHVEWLALMISYMYKFPPLSYLSLSSFSVTFLICTGPHMQCPKHFS